MGNRLWISTLVANEIVQYAVEKWPQETGGMLVGYIGENGDGVVSRIIGPGPGAFHSRYGFKPDHDYQIQQLEMFFRESGGADDYLGDWHTHPAGSNSMSWKDRRTLTRIARSTAKTLPKPFMLIFSMEKEGWIPGAHQFESLPKRWFRPVTINRVSIEIF